MSVKVAVRVRPFSQRETQLKSTLCVQMDGNKTILTDPSGEQKQRDFNFDYSFWSHDSFNKLENGYLEPATEKFSDQKKVFDAVGREVLENAWNGYHCCLFAYGQTGSGKSYSMIGYGNNQGIVPIACEEIFSRIASENKSDVKFEVQFSMLEIYNEKIQDLLTNINSRSTGGLKVREHKSVGIYVEGLSKHAVKDYKSIQAKMAEGNRNRTIGATLMNANSSRAHTIIQIEFKQIKQIGQRRTAKLSIMNLVDLAGSEKLGKTGAEGDRMKEGCSINKSLTVLGMVISILAEKSVGKSKNFVVPYRDSVLTRILQNALGGNSKTLMICALSPASYNYEETLSTLRYADQAKKIKNNAIINESEQDKLIRELQDENKKLKEMLQTIQNNLAKGEKVSISEDIEDMQDQLEANAILMQECEQTYEQKLQQNAEITFTNQEQEKFDYSKPYLINLSEDPLLDGKIQYSLSQDVIQIGKKSGSPLPDIILGGIGVNRNHAVILQYDKKIKLKPVQRECGEFLYINGKNCYIESELHNNDRIIIGTNNIFLLKINGPDQELQGDSEKNEKIDWEFAQAELMKQMSHLNKINEQEFELKRQKYLDLKIKEVEKKLLQEKEASEKQFQLKQQQYEEQIKLLQEKMQKENDDKQNLINEKQQLEACMRKSLEAYQVNSKDQQEKKQNELNNIQGKYNISQQIAYIEHKFSKFMSKIIEVNFIAKELKRDITLHAKICISKKSKKRFRENMFQKMKLLIEVYNKEMGIILNWNAKKFSNRYYIIKEILEKYFESNQLPKLTKEEDPFWDPPEPVLIGQAFVQMMSLAYLMDNSEEFKIMADKGECGKAFISLIPTDEKGENDLSIQQEENQDHFDNPFDLVNQNFYFKVQIGEAKFQENCWKDVFCAYKVKNFEGQKSQEFQSEIIKGLVQNTVTFNYEQVHQYRDLTHTQIQYILDKTICFEFYAYEQRIIQTEERFGQVDIDEQLDIDLIKFKQNKKHQGIMKESYSLQFNLQQETQENIREDTQQEHPEQIEDQKQFFATKDYQNLEILLENDEEDQKKENPNTEQKHSFDKDEKQNDCQLF